jgi:MinD-like ATPase involved in chromosome partitioning or flagellar assembly
MSKTIAIHSFRGGTGKSNLTANIATAIACTGKRVAIIDTDIQSPGIHVLFALGEQRMELALNDYLWGACRIEQTAYDVTPAEVSASGGTVFLVPSSLNPGEIARVLREGYEVSRLIDGLRDLVLALELDYLFIDTHPGLNEETLLSMTISDVLVTILRPDSQDYQGTAVTIELARKLEVPRMLMLVNKVPQGIDGEAVREKVQTAYNAPVVGVLPLSNEMMLLASAGVFVLKSPRHPLAQQIRNIAQDIVA